MPPGLSRTGSFALAGAAIGFLLNQFVVITIYPGVDVTLGSVPVLMVAMVAGWRWGALAAAIAALPTWGLWGHGVGWLAFVLQAAVVGAGARRLHPALLVAAYWLVIGLPLFWLAARWGVAGLAPYVRSIAIKTPIQEIFASLLALNLMFLAPVRESLHRRWPDLSLPVVSLRSFQLSFIALMLVSVAGAVMVFEGRAANRTEREALAHQNLALATATAREVGTHLNSYQHLVALAAVAWERMSPSERDEAARRMLEPSGFEAVLLLRPGGGVRAEWLADHLIKNRPWVRAWAGTLSRSRHLGEMHVAELPSAPSGEGPWALMGAPISGGGMLVAVLPVSALAHDLLTTPFVTTDEVSLLDRAGHVLMHRPAQPLTSQAPVLVPNAPEASVSAEAAVPGTSWHTRVTTPGAVVVAQVDRAMLRILPPMALLLLLLAALGIGLMWVLGRELRRLERATQQLASSKEAPITPSGSFLVEIDQLDRTLGEVSRTLFTTWRELRGREAEMAIANAKLEATINELKRADASRSEVINTISHDIKIPLTAVLGYTELLEDELAGPLNPQQHDYVSGIDDNTGRVLHLLEDLLDMARMDVGRFPIAPEEVDLYELLARTTRRLQPLSERAELEVALPASPNLPSVWADPGRVEQVLTNLLSNAIKFTPAGGCVTIRAFPSPTSAEVVVQVTDTGPGIAAEHLPHLFDRFYRVDPKAPGTGLGLAISKSLIEAMGGHIGVISQPGKGSTFWFTLPLAPQPAARAPADAEA